MSFFSAALLLFLVMDPFGNVPLFLSVLRPVPDERRRRVIAREMLIALGFMLVFLFFGRHLLAAIEVGEDSLTVAGGMILLFIAIRMIFPPPGGAFSADIGEAGEEPFLVPLAVPFVAGPSVLASILFIINQAPQRWPTWLAATLTAWSASGIVLLLSANLGKLLKRRGLIAIERLMGMVLVAIATRMILTGIRDFFALAPGSG
ncbi:MAG: MarC family protein [Planctomycetota bacterium]